MMASKILGISIMPWFSHLLLQLLQGILDAEDRLEDWTLQDRDESLEIRVDLAIAAQVISLANFELGNKICV